MSRPGLASHRCPTTPHSIRSTKLAEPSQSELAPGTLRNLLTVESSLPLSERVEHWKPGAADHLRVKPLGVGRRCVISIPTSCVRMRSRASITCALGNHLLFSSRKL